MSKIPNITQVITPNKCSAMRCKADASHIASGAHWGHAPALGIPLCDVHGFEGDAEGASESFVSVSGTEVLERVVPAPSAGEDTARALVASTSAEADESLALVEQLRIDTQEDLAFVSELLVDVKTKLNYLLEAEAKITSPLNALLKGARDLFRPARNKLTLLEAVLKGKIAQAKAEEAANNARALALAAQAQAQGDAEVAAAAIAQVRHQSNVEGVKTRLAWGWEVESLEDVPLEYLVVNEKMLNWLCKGSEIPKPVPGIKFVQKTIVSVNGAGVNA